MLDNKTLRDTSTRIVYVIVVKRDGVLKYVQRHYFRQHSFKFTVKLDDAMRFNTAMDADHFVVENSIPGFEKICIVLIETKLMGSAYSV